MMNGVFIGFCLVMCSCEPKPCDQQYIISGDNFVWLEDAQSANGVPPPPKERHGKVLIGPPPIWK